MLSLGGTSLKSKALGGHLERAAQTSRYLLTDITHDMYTLCLLHNCICAGFAGCHQDVLELGELPVACALPESLAHVFMSSASSVAWEGYACD